MSNLRAPTKQPGSPLAPPAWVVATEEYETNRDSEYREGDLYGPFDSEDAAFQWLVAATNEERIWRQDDELEPWDWASVRALADDDDGPTAPYLVGAELSTALLEYVSRSTDDD